MNTQNFINCKLIYITNIRFVNWKNIYILESDALYSTKNVSKEPGALIFSEHLKEAAHSFETLVNSIQI